MHPNVAMNDPREKSSAWPSEQDEMPMRLGGPLDPKPASPDKSATLEAKEISHDGTALRYHCYVCVLFTYNILVYQIYDVSIFKKLSQIVH